MGTIFKNQVLILLILALSGCEAVVPTNSNGGAAEVEEVALTSELLSDNAQMDFRARSARNLNGALQVCAAAMRNLCTNDQYRNAFDRGLIALDTAHPANLWMPETVIPLVGRRNIFQATSREVNYLLIDTDLTRPFYCCTR